MSAFAPINVAAGLEQKRQLLQRLMQQYQAGAARAAGLASSQSAASAPASGAAFHASRPFGGVGNPVFSHIPNMVPGLAGRLGPGGTARPMAPVAPGIAHAMGLANPHAGSVLGFGAGAPTGSMMPVAHPASPGPAAAPPSMAVGAMPGASSPASGVIQLGNGLVYDPSTGAVLHQGMAGSAAPQNTGATGAGGGHLVAI